MTDLKSKGLTILLESEAHEVARQFAEQQDTAAKGKRVYLNTLAVYATRSFLQEMSFETDLSLGDSWHPAARCFHDVADLAIAPLGKMLGKIECRPVLPGESAVTLPVETRENRIAYIGVGFEEKLSQVQLLGFAPAASLNRLPEEIPLADLEPIEDLIDYLYRLELAVDFLEQSDDEVAQRTRSLLAEQSRGEIVAQLERAIRTGDKSAFADVLSYYLEAEGAEGEESALVLPNLADTLLEKVGGIWQEFSRAIVSVSEWFDNIFEAGWQAVSSIGLGREEPLTLGLRSALSRVREPGASPPLASARAVKLVELKAEGIETTLALVSDVELEADENRDIIFQLYPTGGDRYVPPGTQLLIMDESGDTFLEAKARSGDNWLQLGFISKPPEQFGVKVVLGDASFTEYFVA